MHETKESTQTDVAMARANYRSSCTYVHLFGLTGISLLATPYRIRIHTGSQASTGTNAAVQISLISNVIVAIFTGLDGGFPKLS